MHSKCHETVARAYALSHAHTLLDKCAGTYLPQERDTFYGHRMWLYACRGYMPSVTFDKKDATQKQEDLRSSKPMIDECELACEG